MNTPAPLRLESGRGDIGLHVPKLPGHEYRFPLDAQTGRETPTLDTWAFGVATTTYEDLKEPRRDADKDADVALLEALWASAIDTPTGQALFSYADVLTEEHDGPGANFRVPFDVEDAVTVAGRAPLHFLITPTQESPHRSPVVPLWNPTAGRIEPVTFAKLPVADSPGRHSADSIAEPMGVAGRWPDSLNEYIRSGNTAHDIDLPGYYPVLVRLDVGQIDRDTLNAIVEAALQTSDGNPSMLSQYFDYLKRNFPEAAEKIEGENKDYASLGLQITAVVPLQLNLEPMPERPDSAPRQAVDSLISATTAAAILADLRNMSDEPGQDGMPDVMTEEDWLRRHAQLMAELPVFPSQRNAAFHHDRENAPELPDDTALAAAANSGQLPTGGVLAWMRRWRRPLAAMQALVMAATSLVAVRSVTPAPDLAPEPGILPPDLPPKGGDDSGQDPLPELPADVPSFEYPSQYAEHYFGPLDDVDYMQTLRDMSNIAIEYGWAVATDPGYATTVDIDDWSMPTVQGPGDPEPRTDALSKFMGLVDAVKYAADLGDENAQTLLATLEKAGIPNIR